MVWDVGVVSMGTGGAALPLTCVSSVTFIESKPEISFSQKDSFDESSTTTSDSETVLRICVVVVVVVVSRSSWEELESVVMIVSDWLSRAAKEEGDEVCDRARVSSEGGASLGCDEVVSGAESFWARCVSIACTIMESVIELEILLMRFSVTLVDIKLSLMVLFSSEGVLDSVCGEESVIEEGKYSKLWASLKKRIKFRKETKPN